MMVMVFGMRNHMGKEVEWWHSDVNVGLSVMGLDVANTILVWDSGRLLLAPVDMDEMVAVVADPPPRLWWCCNNNKS